MDDTGQQQPSTQPLGSANDDRYQSALAYVELDRTHRKRSRWSTVLVISAIVLAASLVMLSVVGFSYLQGQMKNNQIAENADLKSIGPGFDSQNFAIDWDALLATNPDTVGWLYVPGTAINYPVVRGADNDYYLSHDFNGDEGWLAQFGSIFMDWRNKPNWSDQAYFIYGHHMNDGSMFADIASLSDQARFDASRTVYLLSPKGNFQLKTFSLIHCASDDPLVQISFPTAQDMTSYVQDKMDRSIVSAGEVPAAADITKVFAFATCDNYSSGRYVLYAYVEKKVGVTASDASNAAVRDGGAAGRIDDLPAGRGEEASSSRLVNEQSQSGGSQEDGSRSRDDSSDEDYDDEAYAGDEDSSYDESGAGQGVSVGDYDEYAGGYYTYDGDGDLVWVPTDE